MTWVERGLKDHLVPTLSHGQGCNPLDQAAQGPIQPVLECLQGSIASLGSLCHCLTSSIIISFFLLSDLNLLSYRLKTLPLLLSLHTPIKSLSSHFLCAPFRLESSSSLVSVTPDAVCDEWT